MRRRGVTLIELIVCTGMIALLMGIALPVLSRVSAAGRATECQSNLRQMVFAAQQYAAVFQAFPAALRYENTGVHTTIAWDWIQETGGPLIGPGPLWSFTDDPGAVQQCPDYLGDAAFGADPFTGYNYNTSYLGAEATSLFSYGWASLRGGTRPHACSRSSSCAMFGDGGRRAGTNKFMRAPLNHEGLALETLYSGGQAFRHLGGCHAAFVDGHVGTTGTPARGELASPDMLEMVMGFPNVGFLSDDDRAYDPRW